MNLDDIFNVGRQNSDEGGEWIGPGCITCGRVNDRGSWCRWHHPAHYIPPSKLTPTQAAEEFQLALDQVNRILSGDV